MGHTMLQAPLAVKSADSLPLCLSSHSCLRCGACSTVVRSPGYATAKRRWQMWKKVRHEITLHGTNRITMICYPKSKVWPNNWEDLFSQYGSKDIKSQPAEPRVKTTRTLIETIVRTNSRRGIETTRLFLKRRK